MPLNIAFFYEKSKKKWNFSKFSNFQNFWKKSNFQKKFQSSNCSKKFAFWVMTKQKNLQRDFIMKITFPKKYLARAHFCARRALNHTSLWKLKNHRILAQVAEYSERARAKNFFRIEKFIKFPTFYIFWMFLYHLNSWF